MSLLHVADDIIKRLGSSEGEALLEIACRLYETAKLRFDEAAKLASVSLDIFAAACEARKIPVYWLSDDELESDLAAASQPR